LLVVEEAEVEILATFTVALVVEAAQEALEQHQDLQLLLARL
jgi:hypothetical protein